MHLENAKVSQDVKSSHQSFGQVSTRSKTIIIINTRLGQVKRSESQVIILGCLNDKKNAIKEKSREERRKP
ncbi:unnamed protein product [Cochlearia groenlandica]